MTPFRYRFVLSLLFLITVLPAYAAWAQSTVSYQGYLTEADGSPLNAGDLAVDFALFEGPTSTTLLWSETQSLTVVDGLFRVDLGSETPFPPVLDFSLGFYLEMTVAGETLEPRIRLTPAPTALTVPDGTITPDKIATTNPPTDGQALVYDAANGQFRFDDLPEGGSLNLPFGGTDVSNAPAAMNIQKQGEGRAGAFQILSPTSTDDALTGFTNGSGVGVRGVSGTGIAGSFEVNSTASEATALVAHTIGDGKALRAESDQGTAVSVQGDFNGVFVEEATRGSGVAISKAGTDGVAVTEAGRHGMAVFRAGTPPAARFPTGPAGFAVNGAEKYGLYVGSVGGDGAFVETASGNGFSVAQAGTGLRIGQAQQEGIYVGAAEDGLFVSEARDTGVTVGSAHTGMLVTDTQVDGVRLNNLGEHGVRVSNAGMSGVRVFNSGASGISISGAGQDGIHVESANQDGLNVTGNRHGIFAKGDADGDGNGFAGAFDGHVIQRSSQRGLVKAAAKVECDGDESNVLSAFNNINGTVTISAYPDPPIGMVGNDACLLDFGFPIDFWSVSMADVSSVRSGYVACETTPDDLKLRCLIQDTSSTIADVEDIMIVVY